MDKFSKLEKKKPKKAEAEELFDGGYLKIVKKDNWTFLTESDNACVLPILLDENKILVRMEVVTPFKYRDKNDYHLTCISGTIEEGETPLKTTWAFAPFAINNVISSSIFFI